MAKYLSYDEVSEIKKSFEEVKFKTLAPKGDWVEVLYSAEQSNGSRTFAIYVDFENRKWRCEDLREYVRRTKCYD